MATDEQLMDREDRGRHNRLKYRVKRCCALLSDLLSAADARPDDEMYQRAAAAMKLLDPGWREPTRRGHAGVRRKRMKAEAMG